VTDRPSPRPARRWRSCPGRAEPTGYAPAGTATRSGSARADTPHQSAICVEIDLAGLLRRPDETLHSIDVCHDAVHTLGRRHTRRARRRCRAGRLTHQRGISRTHLIGRSKASACPSTHRLASCAEAQSRVAGALPGWQAGGAAPSPTKAPMNVLQSRCSIQARRLPIGLMTRIVPERRRPASGLGGRGLKRRHPMREVGCESGEGIEGFLCRLYRQRSSMSKD
jgi:hypothetical protein